MINEINNIFKTPIFFNSKKVDLNKSISADLELTETIEMSGNSIYSNVFNCYNDISTEVAKQLSSIYTTDVDFLKENQRLLSTL